MTRKAARDCTIVADVDRRMPERTRQEHRHGYIGRYAARERNKVRTETDLRDLKLAMEVGALEAFLDRHGEVIDVAAFDGNAPIDDSADAVIVPGRNG